MGGKKGEQSEGIRNIRFLCNFTKYIAVHFAVFNRVFMIGLIENMVFVQSWKLMQLFGEIISAKTIRHKARMYEK